MSGPADSLQRLQETEHELRASQERIGELRRVLDGDPAAEDHRPRLLRAEARRKALSGQLEQAETREREERARARSHERQLYSGVIHNPRELTQLSEELDHLRVQLATEEVEEMELLSSLDEADRELADALSEAETTRAELKQQEQQADNASRRIADQRAAIPAAHLRLYDRVAAFRPAPAVVDVRDGVCAGCRLPLSHSQLRALRMSADPLTCETCGRILIAP